MASLLQSKCVKVGSQSIHYAVPNANAKTFSSYEVFEFGKPSENSEQKTLLLVGRTGTGKSTLINSLFNYIIGINWQDEHRYHFTPKKPDMSDRSETHKITAYTLHHQEGYKTPYTWTVIDTPGFDNTLENLTDNKIADQLQEFLSEAPDACIKHIDAVGFAVPASLKWFDGVEQFVYRTLQELFGQDIHTNLCFLITFADLKTPARSAIFGSKIPQPKYIPFNNSALYSEILEQEESETKTDKMMKKLFWKKGRNGCKKLLHFINELKEITLKKTPSDRVENFPLDNLKKGEAKMTKQVCPY